MVDEILLLVLSQGEFVGVLEVFAECEAILRHILPTYLTFMVSVENSFGAKLLLVFLHTHLVLLSHVFEEDAGVGFLHPATDHASPGALVVPFRIVQAANLCLLRLLLLVY